MVTKGTDREGREGRERRERRERRESTLCLGVNQGYALAMLCHFSENRLSL
jgi:hypothetical protein